MFYTAKVFARTSTNRNQDHPSPADNVIFKPFDTEQRCKMFTFTFLVIFLFFFASATFPTTLDRCVSLDRARRDFGSM